MTKVPTGFATATSALGMSISSVAAAYLSTAPFPGAAAPAGLLSGVAGFLVNHVFEQWKQRKESKEHLADTLHNEHLASAAADALRHSILSASAVLRGAGARLDKSLLVRLADAAAEHWCDLHRARDSRVAPFDVERLVERLVEHLTLEDPLAQILQPAWLEILKGAESKANLGLGLDDRVWDRLAQHVAGEYSSRLYNAFKSDLSAGGGGGPAFAGIVLRLLADLHRAVRDLSDVSRTGEAENQPAGVALKQIVNRLRRISEGIRRDTSGLVGRVDANTRAALSEFIVPLHEEVRAVRRGQRSLSFTGLGVLGLILFIIALLWWMKSDQLAGFQRVEPTLAAKADEQAHRLEAMFRRQLDQQAEHFAREISKSAMSEEQGNLVRQVMRRELDEQAVRLEAALANASISNERAKQLEVLIQRQIDEKSLRFDAMLASAGSPSVRASDIARSVTDSDNKLAKDARMPTTAPSVRYRASYRLAANLGMDAFISDAPDLERRVVPARTFQLELTRDFRQEDDVVRTEMAAVLAHMHIEAIGGRERLAKLQSIRATGTTNTNGVTARFTLTAARPAKLRLETETGGRTVLLGFDETSEPWKLDTGIWPPKYVYIEEPHRKITILSAEYDDPLVGGTKRGFILESIGDFTDGRHEYSAVLVRHRLEDPYTVLVDAKTYLIAMRIEGRLDARGNGSQLITEYDDYRPVQGVLLPHRLSQFVNGALSDEAKIVRIDPNPATTAETFSRPLSKSSR